MFNFPSSPVCVNVVQQNLWGWGRNGSMVLLLLLLAGFGNGVLTPACAFACKPIPSLCDPAESSGLFSGLFHPPPQLRMPGNPQLCSSQLSPPAQCLCCALFK